MASYLHFRCSTGRDWRRNHHQRVEGGILQMAAQTRDVPLQNGYWKSGKAASYACCEWMSLKIKCTSAQCLLAVYGVFAAQRANGLPAGALCGASSHITRLELGLLWRVCLLSRIVPPCLECVPPARTECDFNLQTDLTHHPSWLPSTWCCDCVCKDGRTSVNFPPFLSPPRMPVYLWQYSCGI